MRLYTLKAYPKIRGTYVVALYLYDTKTRQDELVEEHEFTNIMVALRKATALRKEYKLG